MSPHDIGFDQDHTPRSEYGDYSAAQCKYGSYGRYGTCMVTTEDKCTKDVFPRTENDALSGAETCRLFRKLPIIVVSEWGTFGGATMGFVDGRGILFQHFCLCAVPVRFLLITRNTHSQLHSATHHTQSRTMASHPPGQCCTVGVKHEGEAKGKIEKVGGSEYSLSILPRKRLLM